VKSESYPPLSLIDDPVVSPYDDLICRGELLTSGIEDSDKDNQCNNKEDYLSCPSDCLPYEKDGYCNYQPGKEQCDPDCPEGVDWDCRHDLTTEAIITPSTGIEYDIFVILGIFAVGVSVIIFILARRKKQKLLSLS
jgi:LPXTG-motif cell wall-anchored protein